MKSIILLFTLSLLTACSASSVSHTPATLETLYGYGWQGKVLAVDVVSHGCTKAKDFALDWPDPDRLVIKRLRPDRCRKAATIERLTFVTNRRRGQPVQMVNPVVSTRLKSFVR